MALVYPRGRGWPTISPSAPRSRTRPSGSTTPGARRPGRPSSSHVEDDRPRSLAALTISDVLLVNPVRDGLNLVAKEGSLLNAVDGVLVLSHEAGAWEELSEAALGVNPFDVSGTADALHRALSWIPRSAGAGPPACGRWCWPAPPRTGWTTSSPRRAQPLAAPDAAAWSPAARAEPPPRPGRRPPGPPRAATSGGLSSSTTATRTTATPCAASSAAAAKAGRSPRSSPKTATARMPCGQRSDHRPLVHVERAAAARATGGPDAPADPRVLLPGAGEAVDPGTRLGGVAPVQGHRQALGLDVDARRAPRPGRRPPPRRPRLARAGRRGPPAPTRRDR